MGRCSGGVCIDDGSLHIGARVQQRLSFVWFLSACLAVWIAVESPLRTEPLKQKTPLSVHVCMLTSAFQGLVSALEYASGSPPLLVWLVSALECASGSPPLLMHCDVCIVVVGVWLYWAELGFRKRLAFDR